MAAARVVQIILTGNADQATRELTKLTASAEASSKSVSSSFLSIGKAATIGLVAGVAAAAVIGVKAAQEQEVATARLANAMHNAGFSIKEYGDQIAAAEKHAINLGFADEELDNSLSRLLPATKNVAEAVKDSNLAMDIARARHISLETATDALVKVEGGRYTALTRMLGLSKDVVASFDTQQEALDYLAKTYGGSASAYTETFAGKIEVLKAHLDEVAEKIGFFLIPIIEDLASALSDVIGWFEKNRTVAVALGIVIGGALVSAMLYYIGTALVAFATTGALGGAMSTLVTVALIAAAAVESLGVAMGFTGAAALAMGTIVTAGAALVVAGLALLVLHFANAKSEADKMRESSKALVDQWEAQDRSIGGVKGALEGMRDQLETSTTRMEGLREGIKDASAAMDEQGGVFGAAADKHGMLIDLLANEKILHGELKDKVAELKVEYALASAAENQRKVDLDNLANGTTNLANATDAAKTAIVGMQNAILGAQGGQIGYQQSVLNVQTAEAKLAELQASGTATSEELRAAQLNVEQAHIAVAAAALKLYDDQDSLNNLLNTEGVGALEGVRQKLLDTIATQGDESGALQDQVNKITDMINWWNILHSLPDVHKTATVDVVVNNVSQLGPNYDWVLEPLRQAGLIPRALGGQVGAGVAYKVGERGPEMFVPNTSGTIIPNNALGGGGPITVQVMLDRQVLAEAMVSELNRAGGPKISQNALN